MGCCLYEYNLSGELLYYKYFSNGNPQWNNIYIHAEFLHQLEISTNLIDNVEYLESPDFIYICYKAAEGVFYIDKSVDWDGVLTTVGFCQVIYDDPKGDAGEEVDSLADNLFDMKM